MLILSVCHGGHESSAVVAEGYDILSAVHTERITRKKEDGQYARMLTINAALQAAGANMRDVQAFPCCTDALPLTTLIFTHSENV